MTLKQLELAWRRFWIRRLTHLLARHRAVEPPRWGERPHRVLFLRHDRIGDMILSTGVLHAIAASHPTIQLDVLASPANAPILAADPTIHEVVVFARGRLRHYPALVRKLRRARYDAVVDCMVTAPSLTTLLLMWASGARHRVGVAGRGNDAAYTVLVPPLEGDGHIAEHLMTLAAAFGVDPRAAGHAPTIALAADELQRAASEWGDAQTLTNGARPTRVLVNVSAGRHFRQWPDERFAAVVARVRERRPDAIVLLIGAPDDRERIERIAVASGGAARIVPTRSIRDALALVATADYVVTPDTSIAHAASAFHRPAVAFYIRGTARRWGLLGPESHVLESPDGTLVSLEAAPVLRAVDQLLG